MKLENLIIKKPQPVKKNPFLNADGSYTRPTVNPFLNADGSYTRPTVNPFKKDKAGEKENPFKECIERGRALKKQAEEEKRIRHKKFMKCFRYITHNTDYRHPNEEMI